MRKTYCESCGIEWINHLGVEGTCEKHLDWKHISYELAQVLYKPDRTEEDIEKVLGEYEKLRFLRSWIAQNVQQQIPRYSIPVREQKMEDQSGGEEGAMNATIRGQLWSFNKNFLTE